jgi:hypothetical protein
MVTSPNKIGDIEGGGEGDQQKKWGGISSNAQKKEKYSSFFPEEK